MGNPVQPEGEMKCVHHVPRFEREQGKNPNSSCHLLDWLKLPNDVGPCKPPLAAALGSNDNSPLSGTPPTEVKEPFLRLSTQSGG